MLKGIEMIYDKQLVSKRYNGENFESVVLLSLMDLIGLNEKGRLKCLRRGNVLGYV